VLKSCDLSNRLKELWESFERVFSFRGLAICTTYSLLVLGGGGGGGDIHMHTRAQLIGMICGYMLKYITISNQHYCTAFTVFDNSE
jgi:hypothetical protein